MQADQPSVKKYQKLSILAIPEGIFHIKPMGQIGQCAKRDQRYSMPLFQICSLIQYLVPLCQPQCDCGSARQGLLIIEIDAKDLKHNLHGNGIHPGPMPQTSESVTK